nr:hypothetical protein CFP56_52283 [Quercus suber]
MENQPTESAVACYGRIRKRKSRSRMDGRPRSGQPAPAMIAPILPFPACTRLCRLNHRPCTRRHRGHKAASHDSIPDLDIRSPRPHAQLMLHGSRPVPPQEPHGNG